MLFATTAMRAPTSIGGKTSPYMSTTYKQVKLAKATNQGKTTSTNHENFDAKMLKTNFIDGSDIQYTIKMNNKSVGGQVMFADANKNKFELSLMDNIAHQLNKGSQRTSNYDVLLNRNASSKNGEVQNVNL